MPIKSVLRNKFDIIKDREAERMARYLRILFGKDRFGFRWVDSGTSYTDGKDIFALYPFRRPDDGELYETPEQRVLRKATSIHERGHIEYDIIEDYFSWQKQWSSNDKDKWLDNEKYPISWLQFFGNVMLDGRMENFVVNDHPTTQEYLDYKNYQWKVPVFEEQQGHDPLDDFRTCFFRRAMGMTDYDGWLEVSVELAETIQPLIEKARESETTKQCLEHTVEMIKGVWPTLLEWMDLENEEPNDFDYDDEHGASQWGEEDEVEQNVKRVLVKISKHSAEEEGEGNSAGSGESEEDDSDTNSSSANENEGEDEDEHEQNEPSENDSDEEGDNTTSESEKNDAEDDSTHEPDFSKVLTIETKAMEKDEQEAEEALGPYSDREDEVTVWEHREDRKSYSEKVRVTPFDEQNIDRYNSTLCEIKRYINPTSKALQQLLDPVPDEKRRNQRSGKLKVNRAWRSENLGDGNVFDKRKKGTPGKDARILLLNDVSGSTMSQFPGSSHRIIDEMRKAQVLMIESCEKANIPVASYGFTEDYTSGSSSIETLIFPFKPYNRFSSIEKGFVGGINSRGGNRDTLSLQWAVDELATFPEDVRLLIMLSDGEPCFESGEDYNTMRSIVQQAEKRGIEILCLYVGPQEKRVLDNVRYMYPGRSIIVSKQLQRELTRHVKRIIRKRK